jgi:hypothetical protein
VSILAKKTHAIAASFVVAVAACGAQEGASAGATAAANVDPDAPVRSYTAEVPLAYYQLSFKFSKRTGGFTPPVQARAFAYMGLALYESLVAGMPRQRSIASQLSGIGELPQAHGTYYWPLVASAALAEVMRGLWGDATNVAAQNIADINALEDQFETEAAGVQGSLSRRSIDFGRAVGAAVFETSKDDGEHRSYLTNFPTSYEPPVGPGLWVPLGPPDVPSVQLALQPFWADEGSDGKEAHMTPFVSPGADCDPGPPPTFSEDPESDFYQQAREVYDTVNNLTDEQKTIARFWADGPGTINGPGHSLSTTSQILAQGNANLEQSAETFARVGIAVADAVLTCWYSKYKYNLIRPITYINKFIDLAWNTLLPTPPFPEYTSAHSVQTAAALSTLQALFGDVGYEDHTHDTDGFSDGFAPRTFDSLTASMTETGISRLYGGIHFHSAIFDGFEQGRCISARVNALGWRKDTD